MSHMNKQSNVIGKPARRVDALEKVLGTARYLGDYKVPDMLFARARRSDIPHGRIVKLDTSPALKVPGVLAVITSDDFVEHGWYGFPVKDNYMLAYQKVRHVGEAIAVVAAETPEAALKGAQAIIVELESLPVLSDMDHALDADAPQVGPDRTDGKSPNFLDCSIVRKGEPLEMLKQCDVTIDEKYAVPHQEHAYMETEGALAVPTPEGGVVVYASNQSPFINKGNIASTLGLPENRVRVIQPHVGGSFGGKDDLNYESSAQTACLALKTGRPVRMTFSREESMIASYKRDAMNMRVQLGADKDGTLRACKFDGTLDSGGYASESSFTGWRASIHSMGPYRYDACHVDVTSVYTNNSYSGAFRGFGNTEIYFAVEQAIDELAEKVGMDPIDFRLKNCLKAHDEIPHGQKLDDSVGMTECLEKVRKMSDWDRKRKEYAAYNATNPAIRKGIGVSAIFHGTSLGAEGADNASGTIQLNNDYTVTITSGLTDFGQGSRTVFCLIAAEVLGVALERIQIFRPDTDTAIDSGPTVASRATMLGGNATRIAAENLAQMLDMAAADMLNCEVEQLVRHGEKFIGPQEEPVEWEAVVDHARSMGLVLSAHSRWDAPANHWDEKTGRGTPYIAYHFGAQVMDIEVDTGTGKTTVKDVYAVHDIGRTIFLEGAFGQLYGGIAQGLGYALTEKIEYVDGYIQQTNFDEYIMPTAMDIPDIHGEFVEYPYSAGPFGAKNIAEPSMVPVSSAIANAISHATGRRVRKLPCNLEAVLLGHDLQKGGEVTACKIGLLTSPTASGK